MLLSILFTSAGLYISLWTSLLRTWKAYLVPCLPYQPMKSCCQPCSPDCLMVKHLIKQFPLLGLAECLPGMNKRVCVQYPALHKTRHGGTYLESQHTRWGKRIDQISFIVSSSQPTSTVHEAGELACGSEQSRVVSRVPVGVVKCVLFTSSTFLPPVGDGSILKVAPPNPATLTQAKRPECRRQRVSYSMDKKRTSRHCHSLHVGFPSVTQAQQELRIFLATSPLAAIQYLQREREGRQESPWGHCPVRGQTNTDQVPQKLSATSIPNLRTETKAPYTQNKDKILKLKNKRKEIDLIVLLLLP